MNQEELNNRKKLLIAMAMVMSFSVAIWQALLNNFAIEVADFTGKEIGILHSIREIPGFLAFSVIFVLLVFKEKTVALGSLTLMCFGILITGFFPSEYGLYATTIIMSFGFHYYQAIASSLTLQWLPKEETASFMGKVIAFSSVAGISAYGTVYILTKFFHVDFIIIYFCAGMMGVLTMMYIWKKAPETKSIIPQNKKLFLRKRYWLYYALVFMGGARRQIFMVFAAFLLVEKFGYKVENVAALYIINTILNIIFAPLIGKMVGKIGEKYSLLIEYVGLFIVFTSYALVEVGWIAAGLFIIDHLFFSMAIAIQTYFQKIADPKDLSTTAAVSFTINHIAAIVIPVALGLIWIYNKDLVFYIGSGMAVLSFGLAFCIPSAPKEGNETIFTQAKITTTAP